MSNDPIKTLTDTLTLLRVEIADVKKRQITEERLKHLQTALEDNAEKIAGVQNAASRGGKEGASRLAHSLAQTARDMQGKVDDAVRSLSEARRAVSGTVLARSAMSGSSRPSQPLQGLPRALWSLWWCSITIWAEILRTASSLLVWIGPALGRMVLLRISRTGSSVCSRLVNNPQATPSVNSVTYGVCYGAKNRA